MGSRLGFEACTLEANCARFREEIEAANVLLDLATKVAADTCLTLLETRRERVHRDDAQKLNTRI